MLKHFCFQLTKLVILAVCTTYVSSLFAAKIIIAGHKIHVDMVTRDSGCIKRDKVAPQLEALVQSLSRDTLIYFERADKFISEVIYALI